MSDVRCQMIQVASCQLFGASSWKQAMIVDRRTRVDPFCARPDTLLLLYAPCILTLMPEKLWSCVCMAIGTVVQWNANVPKISKSSWEMKYVWSCGTFFQNARNLKISNIMASLAPRHPKFRDILPCKTDFPNYDYFFLMESIPPPLPIKYNIKTQHQKYG